MVGRRTIKNKYFLVFMLAIGASIITMAFLLTPLRHLALLFLPSSECSHDVAKKTHSPAGNLTAIVIRTNCGATTPFTISIHIRQLHETTEFEDDYFFLMAGPTNIGVEWTSILQGPFSLPSLTVIHEKPRYVMRKAVVWDGVNIGYIER